MPIFFHQRTLKSPVRCSGVGVHSGQNCNLKILPAPENHGIKFKRVDLPNQPCISAHFNQVIDTSQATVIGSDDCIVSTIEHLMATFSAFSIDNALVEIDSYEIPNMDGSSAPFVKMIKEAGIQDLKDPRYFLIVTSPIEHNENEKSVKIFPSPSFKITCSIEFDHPIIGKQTKSIEVNELSFENEISSARTFGFLKDFGMLKFFGLGKGVSLENAVVIGDTHVVNNGGLRFEDEFVRHKILDCIGDFSLLGMPLLGHVVASRTGHAFNHSFLVKFFSEKGCWETKSAYELKDRLLRSQEQVAI